MNNEKTGVVFDIHRGTTHDGPGMRTTVFLKGCPLKCAWCQNPESLSSDIQISWNEKKCIGCMSCKNACINKAVIADENGISINKELCKKCFSCTDACPTGALKKVGTSWTVSELVKEACKDDMFFDEFDGGITVSGGEPTAQPQFLKAFFEELKSQGKNVALDTCGFTTRKVLQELFPLVDIFLYDIKIFDKTEHKKFTGVENDLILENFLWLVEMVRENPEKKIWVRTPLIPEATSTENNISQIGAFLQKNDDVIERWELCAFNNVCKDKYRQLNVEWEYKDNSLMHNSETQSLLVIAKRFLGEKAIVSGLVAKED